MQQGRWDVGTVLQEAWDLYKPNMGLLVAATVVVGFVQGLFSGLNQVMQLFAQQFAQLAGDKHAVLLVIVATAAVSLMVGLVSWAVNVFLSIGLTRMLLATVRGEPLDFAQLFAGLPYLLPALAANALVGLGVVFGLVALIVPGVVLSLGWSFFLFAMLDGDLSPIEALRESWRLTQGEKLGLLLWFFVCGALVTAGLLACCVGVLVVAPYCGVGTALIYERLRRAAGPA